MEGRVDPGVKNHLQKRWTPDARIEAGETIESLLEHPGWGVLEQVVDEFVERGEATLRRLAHETALSVDPADAVKYATHHGNQDGLRFHADVVESILASARKAADELKKAAQREADAAERS